MPNFIDNISPVGAKFYAKKPDGGVGFCLSPPAVGGGRPKFLVFGNSLASQSCISMVGVSTTLSAKALAGATSVTVASISGLSAGNSIAINMYDGSIHVTTVNGTPSGNTVGLTTKLPKLARSAAAFQQFSTARPSTIRRLMGPVAYGLAMLGMPVEMMWGYGYGGGTVVEIMADLCRVLEETRPQYVHFLDVENSLSGNINMLLASVRYKVAMCFRYGAIPLVNTSYPASAAPAAQFDAYNSYVVNTMPTEFPGAFAIDVGKQWVNSFTDSVRAPISGWTDGVHPVGAKAPTIGKFFKDAFSGILPPVSDYDFSVLSNADLAISTGGTAANLEAGSVVPSGFTYTANAGVVATTSATAGLASRIVATIPGTSNISTTQFLITNRYTFTDSGGQEGQAYIFRAKFKINQLVGISLMYPQILYSGGEFYQGYCDATGIAAAAGIGETLVVETPAVSVPLGATYIDITFAIRPVSGLSNGVTIDIEMISMGLYPVCKKG